MALGRAGILCSLLFTALPLLADEPVRYEIRFPNAAHHEAEVRATFSGLNQPTLEVVMSRSSPGRYALHEFVKNIYNVRASDGNGHKLAVSRPTPYQWNVTGFKGTVVFEYTVFGDRVDGTYDGIDLSHAHLNMPATFAWAHGFEHTPMELRVELPQNLGWSVATQLKGSADGAWSAPNLDMWMDSPVEVGPHQMYRWDGGGRHFRLALHTQQPLDPTGRLAKMTEAVTLEAAGVFGAFPQYDNDVYTFLIDSLSYASSDGMEHRDSTVITNGRPLSGDSTMTLIDSVAHEFFHSWNVERIRPRSLEPFDFERVNMSDELWFAEGFTNYYGPLVEARTGLMRFDDFVEELSSTLNVVLNSPGRELFDVIDMSRQAAFADGANSIDPVNRGNTYISYYPFGEALAMGIDLEIRARFPGKSLDDWMRAMWRSHPDVNAPYSMTDLEKTLAEATGSAEFVTDIFEKYIRGQQSMEYESLLARAGLLMRKTETGKIWLDMASLNFAKQGAEITAATRRGSPLYKAGLDRGDRLLKLDGKEVKTVEDVEKFIGTHKPGDVTECTVTGRTGQRDVQVTWTESPSVEIVPFEKSGLPLTSEEKAFRKAWLQSKAISPLPKIE